MKKGEGEAYFENGQKEGEENDELFDFYNVVVNEVSRCLALFHTPYLYGTFTAFTLLFHLKRKR